jgi:hypothetical protein
MSDEFHERLGRGNLGRVQGASGNSGGAESGLMGRLPIGCPR